MALDYIPFTYIGIGFFSFFLGIVIWVLLRYLLHKSIRFGTGFTISLYLGIIGMAVVLISWGGAISSSNIPINSEVLIENITITTKGAIENPIPISGNITGIKANIHSSYSLLDTGYAIVGFGLTFILFSFTMIYTVITQEEVFSGFYRRNDVSFYEGCSKFDNHFEEFNDRLYKIHKDIKRIK